MLDPIKKTIYAGIGAVVISKEAIEKTLGEWVEKGKISSNDAKEFFARASKLGEENVGKICKDIGEKRDETLPFATREQVGEISERLKAIEAKLGIEPACKPSETPAAEPAANAASDAAEKPAS